MKTGDVAISVKTTAAAVLLGLGLAGQPSQAVILMGSGDPAYNTTAPTGALAGSGWQYQGFWGGFLGTPIAPSYFIAAHHVGGAIGQAFTFQGVAYTTTAYWDDPQSDLRIWKVNGTFPTYAPLYSTNNEFGKTFVVLGRGTQRGEKVIAPQVQVTYTTNTVDLKSLGISKKLAQQEFPEATFHGNTMTVVSESASTNYVSKGWKTGPSDGVMRWGQSRVAGTDVYIAGVFDKNGGPDQAYLSGGDSSGAVFIEDNGVWKLAGVNYAVQGPFGLTPTDSFSGAIYDKSGLYVDGVLMPNDGQVRPAPFYATRISNRLVWIQSVINQ
jgi:hypothetical protein